MCVCVYRNAFYIIKMLVLSNSFDDFTFNRICKIVAIKIRHNLLY